MVVGVLVGTLLTGVETKLSLLEFTHSFITKTNIDVDDLSKIRLIY